MEAVGRVAAAISFAEWYVDLIGSHLTGNPTAYRMLTKGMGTRQRIDRVAAMCGKSIADEGLKKRAKTYLNALKKFLPERNDAIRSLYLDQVTHVVRINMNDSEPVKQVATKELSRLRDDILSLTNHLASLHKDLERDAKARRKKVTSSV